ncbi:MAG: hypothetical protein IKK63_01565 [Clostridia bacterium]|nr:hypothetical protein [Clostridia bacterium]
MQEHNFDKILDFLCSGIMSKKERQNVRDELFDHLMCKYETNIAMGMDDELATENAIKDLGDRTVIKYRLSQVHSYYPNLSMKKAMNLLTLGFCLMSFQINIIINIINTGEITKFIGQIIMIVALFCLSKSNDKLKKAFVFGSAEFTLTKIAVAITPALPSVIFWIPHVLYIASCIANIVKWFYLFYGLRDLTAPFKEEYRKTIPYGFASFVNLLSPVYFIWVCSAMIVSENSIPDISEVATGAAYIIIPFALISIIITLIVFVMSSKCLWQNDHEYQIETSSKKKAIAAILAVAIAIVPMLAVDLSMSFDKAETGIYSIDDSDISETDCNSTCEKLMAYGVPEKIIRNLPESEIAKYSDCLPITAYSQREQKFILSAAKDNGTGGFDDGVKTECHACAFEIKDENGNSYYRILSWLEYSANGNYYDQAFFFNYNSDSYIPLNYDGEYNGDFLLILSEENGETLKNEPLDVYTGENALTDSVTGIRFEGKENLLILHAADYVLMRSSMLGNGSHRILEFFHRTFPVSLPCRNAYDAYKNDYHSFDGYGLVRAQLFTEVHFPMPFEDDEYKDLVIEEVAG